MTVIYHGLYALVLFYFLIWLSLSTKTFPHSTTYLLFIVCFLIKCFPFSCAGRRLRGKAFYYVGGKVFCEEDFLVIHNERLLDLH